MTYFCAGEKRRRSVRTSCYASAASDASGSIHRQIRIFLRYRNGIAVRRAAGRNRNEASIGNDAVEGAAIDDQVLDHRKSFGAPWLQVKYVAVFKVTHVELADGGCPFGTVSNSIDHEPARTAYSFAAIMIESNRIFTLHNELFIEHIQHFKKRHMRIHLRMFVFRHVSSVIRTLLPP